MRHAAHVQHQRPRRSNAVLRPEARAAAGHEAVIGHAGGNHMDGTQHPILEQPLAHLLRWRHHRVDRIELPRHDGAGQPGTCETRQQRHVVMQVVLEIGVAGGHHRHTTGAGSAQGPRSAPGTASGYAPDRSGPAALRSRQRRSARQPMMLSSGSNGTDRAGTRCRHAQHLGLRLHGLRIGRHHQGGIHPHALQILAGSCVSRWTRHSRAGSRHPKQ